MNPTIGRIVHYRLTGSDAEQVNRRRVVGASSREGWPAGAQQHVGNVAMAGDYAPMLIIKVWPNEFGDAPGVNGQVFLDGNDSLWVTSAKEGTLPGQWCWPPRSE